MNPIVSVIIPAYNCERYINETIESVLAQTFSDLELIVIDDGSTDRTCELVAAYGCPVRLLHQPNAGVCAARNHGLREARGQYLCLMDHDDYWFPDKLARQVEIMRSHPDCGLVYSQFILWHSDQAGRFSSPESFDLTAFGDGIDDEFSGWIYHQLLLDCWVLTSTAMIRREVFARCGDFDESLPYSEDWDLWLRISQAYPFIKLKQPNTLYRQHLRQGNRLVRDVDYRTRLLKSAVSRWGYCSCDGRCLARKRFLRQLANYHAQYGLHHLQAGNRMVACSAFMHAWATDPLKIKFTAYILAGLFGWKPNY